MVELLNALVQAGLLDADTAGVLRQTLTTDGARAWAENYLAQHLGGALTAQQSRLVDFLRQENFSPGAASWNRWWRQEDDRLAQTMVDAFRRVGANRVAAAAITADSWATWNKLNRDVDEWVNGYYTSVDAQMVGSVPNLNQTAREQVREAFVRWTRGGLDWQPDEQGLPFLIQQLEPVFGPMRARRIAVTETTRIFTEGERLVNDADEAVEGYRWLTVADEQVCPTCGPLHGLVRQKDSSFVHPTMGNVSDPPAHVNCRCAMTPESGATQRYALLRTWQGAG